jgi:hypothetical protein
VQRDVGYIYPKHYTVGVDLGQAQDYTAIVAIETEVATRCYYDEHGYGPHQEPARVEHRVRHLERLPLGVAFDEQIEVVRGIMLAPQLPKGAALVVDFTGVGRPVFEMFGKAGLKPAAGVNITGGNEEHRHETVALVWNVAKILLVSRVLAELNAGTLKIAPVLAEAEALRQEFSEFKMRFSDGGRAQFGAREGRHDDLVLGLAIALWWAHRQHGRGPGFSQSRLWGV